MIQRDNIIILPNDMTLQVMKTAIKNAEYPSEFRKIVKCSRKYFGWYTKHFPRVYEYPWLYAKLKDVSGKTIGDFGAGLNPMPLLFAKDGAKIVTIDNSSMQVSLLNLSNANEWGFLDYSVFNSRITSYNKLLERNTFKHSSFDYWYSVSVIEHIPSEDRREILFIIKCLLKNRGEIFLTVDLAKNTELLWNFNQGLKVESEQVHGTLYDIRSEITKLGFDIKELRIIRTPKEERVDTALIHAVFEEN